MQGKSLLRILAAHAFVSHAASAKDLPESHTTSSVSKTSTLTRTITITVRFNSDTSIATQESTLTTSPPPSTSPSSPSETMPPPNSLESLVLNSTNTYRKAHLAKPLRWNSTLSTFAQNHAKTCIWKHSGGPYGENLAANFPTTTLAITAWANEEPHYNYGSPKFSHSNGHFTQLVWKNTTDVGCAVVDCDHDGKGGGVKGAYLVCEYWPPGNVEGEFGRNVLKPGIGEHGRLGFGGAEGRGGGLRWRLVVLGVGYLLVGWVV